MIPHFFIIHQRKFSKSIYDVPSSLSAHCTLYLFKPQRYTISTIKTLPPHGGRYVYLQNTSRNHRIAKIPGTHATGRVIIQLPTIAQVTEEDEGVEPTIPDLNARLAIPPPSALRAAL